MRGWNLTVLYVALALLQFVHSILFPVSYLHKQQILGSVRLYSHFSISDLLFFLPIRVLWGADNQQRYNQGYTPLPLPKRHARILGRRSSLNSPRWAVAEVLLFRQSDGLCGMLIRCHAKNIAQSFPYHSCFGGSRNKTKDRDTKSRVFSHGHWFALLLSSSPQLQSTPASECVAFQRLLRYIPAYLSYLSKCKT